MSESALDRKVREALTKRLARQYEESVADEHAANAFHLASAALEASETALRDLLVQEIKVEHDSIDRGFSEYRAGLRKAARLLGAATEHWVGVAESLQARERQEGGDRG